MEEFFHRPVMCEEAVDSLDPRPGGIFVDGTIGGGGHSYEILRRTAPDGILIGIDKDEQALAVSELRLDEFKTRVHLVRGNFSDIKTIIKNFHIEKVHGILIDLGVSSYQLNTASRGFSFSLDAPLDMRMDRRDAVSAYDIVNDYPEDLLKRIVKEYGEEMMASKIVRAIAARRKIHPIHTTRELADLIASVIPYKGGPKKIHPATKTFQALRIAVNDELAHLKTVIADGIDVLREGGRFSIISFHSLEDRIVKHLFREAERGCICPRDFPVCTCHRKKTLRVLTRRPMMPGEEEKMLNPRARSARLRTAERV